MVQLSKQATQHLVQVRGERGHPNDSAARFVRTDAGVGLTFSSRPHPGDQIVETGGIAVYLAPEIVDRLSGGTIDVGEKDGKSALFFRLPRPASRSA